MVRTDKKGINDRVLADVRQWVHQPFVIRRAALEKGVPEGEIFADGIVELTRPLCSPATVQSTDWQEVRRVLIHAARDYDPDSSALRVLAPRRNMSVETAIAIEVLNVLWSFLER